MDNQNSFFPKNLAYLRKQNGLTQAELGNKIDVDQTTIGRWEDGNREPTVGNVANIADFFNVTIPDLLDKDLSIKEGPPISKLDVLYNKTKDILNDDERAMIEATMERAIKKYEEEKNKNG